jgi:hypothetical protein
MRAEHRAGELRPTLAGVAEQLKGADDQGVAAEDRELLAVDDVDRRLAAAQRGVVEAGEIVVDQGGAVQQLDRHGRGERELRVGVAAGARDLEAEARAEAGASRKDGVPERPREPRGVRRVDIGRRLASRACSMRVYASIGSPECERVSKDCQ